MSTQQQREKAKIRDWLDGLGPRCFHFPVLAGGYGKAGIGDRVCCIDGFFIMCEVCGAGAGVSKWQEQRISEVLNAGGIAFWCHTLDEFIYKLGVFGLRK